MTDNKDLKYTPKTYEQFVLEDKFEQNQAIADSYAAELGAYRDIGVQEGYGPCKTCDKGESSAIEFKMACPGKDCEDRAAGYWHHNKDGCRESRMLITSWGNLSCGGCGVSYNMANWGFKCSNHPGEYRSMNKDSWNKTMALALNLVGVNEITQDLNVFVTNHPEKFGFKK